MSVRVHVLSSSLEVLSDLLALWALRVILLSAHYAASC